MDTPRDNTGAANYEGAITNPPKKAKARDKTFSPLSA